VVSARPAVVLVRLTGAWRPRWRMQPRCGLSGVVRAAVEARRAGCQASVGV